MPTLALAGGTSSTLGRAITTSILTFPSTSTWDIVILTRTSSASLPPWLQALSSPFPPPGAPAAEHAFTHPRLTLHPVDYTSHASLLSALRGVHTLISLLFSIDGAQAEREIALLRAAGEAGVRRFAPTAWGLGGLYWDGSRNEEDGEGVLDGMNRGVWEACAHAMQRGEIRCARFNLGVFMNYLAWGWVDSSAETEERSPSVEELRRGGGYAAGSIDAVTEGVGRHGDMSDGSGSFLISLRSGLAEVPVMDDGSYPRVTMTTVRDVGSFVAASLSLEGWEENMDIVGETIELGELIETAEQISGKRLEVRKFTRAELGEKWNAIKRDRNRYVEALWLQFKILYCEDKGWLSPVVNELCPGVKTTSAKEFLERCRGELGSLEGNGIT